MCVFVCVRVCVWHQLSFSPSSSLSPLFPFFFVKLYTCTENGVVEKLNMLHPEPEVFLPKKHFRCAGLDVTDDKYVQHTRRVRKHEHTHTNMHRRTNEHTSIQPHSVAFLAAWLFARQMATLCFMAWRTQKRKRCVRACCLPFPCPAPPDAQPAVWLNFNFNNAWGFAGSLQGP